MDMTTVTVRAAVEDRHAKLYPGGCPMLCEACGTRLGIVNETEDQRNHRNRDRIARAFGHTTNGIGTEVTHG